MKFKKNGWKMAVGLVLFWVGLSACTKTLSYKTVLKEQVISKSVIDSSAEYLYVPSTGATSRTVTGYTRPYFLGEEKIVRLELTREALQAYEVEMDVNYQGNPQNRKLVFEIPISHVEYHCQKDHLDNCRNQEEENNRITWDKKSQFKPDFYRVNVTEANYLPESLNKLIVGKACMTEVSSKPLDYEFDETHINFRIERAMVNDVRCVDWYGYLSDYTASVVSNYSLIKLSTMSTKGYKSLNYPRTDEETFGFFKTERDYTDVDNLSRQSQQLRLMNRWNPQRKEVVYYLSDEFNKPEYALLKKAAYKTVDRINDGLETAGVQFRLVLKEPAKINTGDMRYSMIVLVEDPTGGLLGYGPALVHPRTGEILAARTVMYPGALKQQARGMYEEIREQREKDAAAKKATGTKAAAATDATEGLKTAVEANNSRGNDRPGAGRSAPSNTGKTEGLSVGGDSSKGSALAARGHLLSDPVAFDKALKVELDPRNYQHVGTIDPVDGVESVDLAMARRHACLFQLQEGGIGADDVNPEIVEAFNKRFGYGGLKEWENLEADEKQFVLDLVVPEAFSGVLIHEMGHNLGLRHNFRGSEDKNSFYTKEELAEKGVRHMVQGSSVMEYTASSGLHDLPVFGKYDIAALRFGYQRQVVKADGSILRIEGTLEQDANAAKGIENLGLREFEFCTDESADLNAKCKRFDTGATYTEIVEGIIKRYGETIKRVAYRRGRESFDTVVGSVYYAQSIDRFFFELRTFMENAERVKYRLGIPYDDPAWKDKPELVDLRQAVVKAGNFLNRVLSDPEHICMYQEIGSHFGPGQINIRLTVLNEVTRKLNLSCPREAFPVPEVPVGEEGKGPERYILVGEIGRYFQDQRASDNSKRLEIEVRGSWIDKTLAAKHLFTRRFQETAYDRPSLFDSYTDNFMDFPELKESLTETIKALMSVDGFKVFAFKDYKIEPLEGSDNSKEADRRRGNDSLKLPYNMLGTHEIPQQIVPFAARYLKIPSERALNFIEVLGRQIARQQVSSDHGSLAEKTLDLVGVYKTSAASEGVSPLPPKAVPLLEKGTKYAATKDNEVAYGYIGHTIRERIKQRLFGLIVNGEAPQKDEERGYVVCKAVEGLMESPRTMPVSIPEEEIPALVALNERDLSGIWGDCSEYSRLKELTLSGDSEKAKEAKVNLDSFERLLKKNLEDYRKILSMLPVLNKAGAY